MDQEAQALELSRLIKSEGPISNSSEDELRRLRFAKHIADALSQKSTNSGRVFAIRGRWGDGKTSLMNLVTENLERDEWLLFNPWSWGDSDAIAKALFQEIANKLNTGHSENAKRRAKAFRRYGQILTQTGGPLKAVAESNTILSLVLGSVALASLTGAFGLDVPKLETAAVGFTIAALTVPILGGLLSYMGADKWSEPVEEIKASLNESLKNLDRPLIVFVDDIDRLEEEEIRSLIRQVKANANFPNLVFVLLHQQSIVEAALDPIANGKGRDFLEKIVQMSFDLPAVPKSTVHRIFTRELSKLANQFAKQENGFEDVRWGNMLIDCVQPFVNNLRDARRLTSSLAIHLPLHTEGEFFEVNIIDLLVLETLRVFEPDFHTELFANQDLILGSNRSSNDGRRAEIREQLEDIVGLVRDELQPTAQRALKQLFPQTESILGGNIYGPEWHQEWNASKRVCSPRYFPKYFELQTPLGEISLSDFEFFVSVSGDEEKLKEFIGSIRSKGMLGSLISMIDESVERLPVGNAAVLLPMLFKMAEDSVEEEGPSMFNSSYTQGWRAASWYLRSLPAEERSQHAIDALRKTGALQVASTLIHLNDPASQSENSSNRLEPALTAEELDGLKQEWLHLVRQLSGDRDKLLERDDLISLLFRWRDYSGGLTEPKTWVDSVIDSDEGFCMFLRKATSVGWTTTVGDRVSRKTEGFEKSTISNFIGIHEALERAERLAGTSIEKRFSSELGNLRTHLDLWLQEEESEEDRQL
ncbi:KAP family P-loop NTPase fold protein [Cognatishimia activa]|uniref:KAP family P-loop NTPase fold protein n=1 Tax=Cognatishimia activa TaxID=1715691 RepID=UPI00223043B0|nr:KAP family NTPase [Cognatishimia activa]UZD91918.1 KAP family NTPase [Cognatishimia activa]